MDLIITLALIYFAYRGYQWYSNVQEQVRQGPPPPRNVRPGHDEPIDVSPREDGDTDYIEYEEVN